MTRRWSLRTQFVLFAAACLVPLLIVVVFFLDRSVERSTDQIISNEVTLANTVNRSLTWFLESNENALWNLAQSPDVVSMNADDATSLLGSTRNARAELNGLFLLDENLNLVGSSGTDPEAILEQVEPQLTNTMDQSAVGISDRLEIDEDNSYIVMTVPVTTLSETETSDSSSESASDDTGPNADGGTTTTLLSDEGGSPQPTGTTIGVVGAVVHTNNLGRAVVPYTTSQTDIGVMSTDALVVSTSGIRNQGDAFVTEQLPWIEQALEGETNSFSLQDADDEDQIGVFAPLQYDNTDWAVIVTNPAPLMYTQELWFQGLAVLVASALAILTLAVVYGEFIARPLRRLARSAERIQQGKFDTDIEVTGGGEVRALGTAFSSMADQLRSYLHDVEANQAHREAQTREMRELLRRTVRMQEDERRRIAGEIHDAVSPMITGALYQARALQIGNGSTAEDERAQSLESVNSLLESAFSELHGVIFDLRPPDLDDLGIVAAISAFTQTMERTGLSIRLETTGEPPALTPEVRLGLYRIVQEALHNVVRHAHADDAVVRIESTDELLHITVRDNGTGFDPESAIRPNSLGLLSMHERAAAIGATLTIVSRPAGGTAIIIERPNTGDVMSDTVLADLVNMRTDGRMADDAASPAAEDEQDDLPASSSPDSGVHSS